jgi:hypothetical protein
MQFFVKLCLLPVRREGLFLQKSLLRTRDVWPGYDFFYPGSRVEKIPDPDPNQTIFVPVFLGLKTVCF